MMRRIWVVFRKEVIDNLRDRRSQTSNILYALFGPLMMLAMIYLLGNLFNRDETQNPLVIPLQGGEHAPMLVRFLEQNNATIVRAPADPRAAVKNGDVELVLVIPKEYGEEFSEGRPARVQLVADPSRTSTMDTIERVENLLSAYQSQTAAMRLMARGISPALTRVLVVEQVDVSTEASRGLQFLNTLPYFLILSIFVGGSAVIIDATAGERERRSLEPLLINPVPRWEFVIAKMLASIPFVLAVLIITLAAMAVIFNVVPVEKMIGFRLGIDTASLIKIFILCLPMVLLASALQMIITTFARTYKEAQTYVQWLPLVPALPGIGLTFLTVKPELWIMLIPTFGQQVLINQFLRGEPVAAANVIVSSLVTLAVAGVLVAVAIRLYNRENILFRKDA
ncbi:MAG TPA: ABC transporter permease [Anaerolineaceae bacterium]